MSVKELGTLKEEFKLVEERWDMERKNQELSEELEKMKEKFKMTEERCEHLSRSAQLATKESESVTLLYNNLINSTKEITDELMTMKEKEKLAEALTLEPSECEVQLRKENENLVKENVMLVNSVIHGKRVTADLQFQIFTTQIVLQRLKSNWTKLWESNDEVKAKLRSETSSNVAQRLVIQQLLEEVEEVEDVSAVPAPEPARVSCEHTNELPAATEERKRYLSWMRMSILFHFYSQKALKVSRGDRFKRKERKDKDADR